MSLIFSHFYGQSRTCEICERSQIVLTFKGWDRCSQVTGEKGIRNCGWDISTNSILNMLLYEFESVFQMIRSTKQWRNPLLFLISLQIIIVVLLFFGSQSSDVNKTLKERASYWVSRVGILLYFLIFLENGVFRFWKWTQKLVLWHIRKHVFSF